VGDENFQKKCIAKMEAFRSQGVTMVFVTHNMRNVEMICDRVALLEAGRIVAEGEPAAVILEYERRSAHAS
jgi:ABC-2 type transport system ATP-binding protein